MAEPSVQVTVSLIDEAMVERAARAMFEIGPGEWTWDDLVREDGPERARIWRKDARTVLEATLLSQPGPSAEPEHDESCIVWTGDGFHCDCGIDDESRSATPPRIADMVPGTTDAFANRRPVRHLARRHDVIETSNGTWLLDWYRPDEPYIRKVDPTTIREVTPPPATPGATS